MKFSFTLAASAAITLAAQLAYSATYAYVAVPATDTLNPGEESVISIFLTETFTDPSDSIIGVSDGLFSASVQIQFDSSTAGSPVQVLDLADVTVDTSPGGFSEFSGAAFVGSDLKIDALADPSGSVGVLGVVDGNVRTIKIADVTFTAGSEGETVFRLIDPPGTDDTSTWDVLTTTYLDTEFATPGPTITFTVLPEPGMLGMIGLLALAGRRRRH